MRCSLFDNAIYILQVIAELEARSDGLQEHCPTGNQ